MAHVIDFTNKCVIPHIPANPPFISIHPYDSEESCFQLFDSYSKLLLRTYDKQCKTMQWERECVVVETHYHLDACHWTRFHDNLRKNINIKIYSSQSELLRLLRIECECDDARCHPSKSIFYVSQSPVSTHNTFAWKFCHTFTKSSNHASRIAIAHQTDLTCFCFKRSKWNSYLNCVVEFHFYWIITFVAL